MVGFLTLYFLIYGSIHYEVYCRVSKLLPDDRASKLALIAFFAVMIVAPVASSLIEHYGHYSLARVLAWGGFLWMGFVLLLFIASLLIWLPQLGFFITSRLWPGLALVPGPRFYALAALALAVPFFFYGLIEARLVRVEHVKLETQKLPPGVKRLKVVQISDMHLSLTTGVGAVKAVTDLIRDEKPDLLVSTGDMLDGFIFHLDELARLFDRIEPPLGKFAVSGNHEVYAGLTWSHKCLELLGFTFLRNHALKLGDVVNLVGVDDPQTGNRADETSLLDSCQNGLFTILLKHRPVINPSSQGRFDLQLSGHAHRGQIFPFNFIVAIFYPLQGGLYRLERDSVLYTSRGTGAWGPPLRIFAPPEVTVIEVVRRSPVR